MKSFKIQFFLILVLILSLTTNSYCQENLSKEEVTKYTEMVKIAEGTYQIQMIDTRSLPSVPLSLIQTIEDKRDEIKVVYFQFKPKIRIKILPKQTINKKDFIFINRIIHIASNEL